MSFINLYIKKCKLLKHFCKTWNEKIYIHVSQCGTFCRDVLLPGYKFNSSKTEFLCFVWEYFREGFGASSVTSHNVTSYT